MNRAVATQLSHHGAAIPAKGNSLDKIRSSYQRLDKALTYGIVVAKRLIAQSMCHCNIEDGALEPCCASLPLHVDASCCAYHLFRDNAVICMLPVSLSRQLLVRLSLLLGEGVAF